MDTFRPVWFGRQLTWVRATEILNSPAEQLSHSARQPHGLRRPPGRPPTHRHRRRRRTSQGQRLTETLARALRERGHQVEVEHWSAPRSGRHRVRQVTSFRLRSKDRPETTRRPPPPCVSAVQRGSFIAWRRQDSNLGRQSRRIYSPFPLATRAHRHGMSPGMSPAVGWCSVATT